jgi:pectinesterase
MAGLLTSPSLSAQIVSELSKTIEKRPGNNAVDVNPDTHLELIFPCRPVLGNKGKIRIFDKADNRMVDSLDLSIPPGPVTPNRNQVPYTPAPYKYVSGHFTNANIRPGTPSGDALPNPDTFQLTIIGGFTDAFHFYPVIIHDSTATIYTHNNLLEYNKSYYVQIDSGVLNLKDFCFSGIPGKTGWTFTTKRAPPPPNSEQFVVAADGNGDFNTIQGAVDYIPDTNSSRVTIFIKNGMYEEIVYFRNKTNLTFLGEDRDKVTVCYANNEVFNPHPSNIATNEWPGTFPSRRAAFMGDNSSGIYLVNFTIRSINEKPAQAEGLLLMGEHNIVSNVSIFGSGDALQVNGSVYLVDSRITGYGDNILGRGPAFFDNCELISMAGPHMWIRNTETNHGNVFLNCRFTTIGGVETVIARAPTNHGINYPYCEAVLINCSLEGISPEGWGPVGGETKNIHFWEYNSRNITDGQPVDVSRRLNVSRQLTMEHDTLIIARYSDPAYVLGGWTPEMAPCILSRPETKKAIKGQAVDFRVKAAAIPEACYQWFFNGKAIDGATNPALRLESVNAANAGSYTVTITNSLGSITSAKAILSVL